MRERGVINYLGAGAQPVTPYGPEHRRLDLTSPFRNGIIARRKARKVEAVPLPHQPHLGLVTRQRQIQVGGQETTRSWEFLIRLECQHLAYPGHVDCRYGCEEQRAARV
jgi:hypothetical protein